MKTSPVSGASISHLLCAVKNKALEFSEAVQRAAGQIYLHFTTVFKERKVSSDTSGGVNRAALHNHVKWLTQMSPNERLYQMESMSQHIQRVGFESQTAMAVQLKALVLTYIEETSSHTGLESGEALLYHLLWEFEVMGEVFASLDKQARWDKFELAQNVADYKKFIKKIAPDVIKKSEENLKRITQLRCSLNCAPNRNFDVIISNFKLARDLMCVDKSLASSVKKLQQAVTDFVGAMISLDDKKAIECLKNIHTHFSAVKSQGKKDSFTQWMPLWLHNACKTHGENDMPAFMVTVDLFGSYLAQSLKNPEYNRKDYKKILSAVKLVNLSWFIPVNKDILQQELVQELHVLPESNVRQAQNIQGSDTDSNLDIMETSSQISNDERSSSLNMSSSPSSGSMYATDTNSGSGISDDADDVAMLKDAELSEIKHNKSFGDEIQFEGNEEIIASNRHVNQASMGDVVDIENEGPEDIVTQKNIFAKITDRTILVESRLGMLKTYLDKKFDAGVKSKNFSDFASAVKNLGREFVKNNYSASGEESIENLLITNYLCDYIEQVDQQLASVNPKLAFDLSVERMLLKLSRSLPQHLNASEHELPSYVPSARGISDLIRPVTPEGAKEINADVWRAKALLTLEELFRSHYTGTSSFEQVFCATMSRYIANSNLTATERIELGYYLASRKNILISIRDFAGTSARYKKKAGAIVKFIESFQREAKVGSIDSTPGGELSHEEIKIFSSNLGVAWADGKMIAIGASVPVPFDYHKNNLLDLMAEREISTDGEGKIDEYLKLCVGKDAERSGVVLDGGVTLPPGENQDYYQSHIVNYINPMGQLTSEEVKNITRGVMFAMTQMSSGPLSHVLFSPCPDDVEISKVLLKDTVENIDQFKPGSLAMSKDDLGKHTFFGSVVRETNDFEESKVTLVKHLDYIEVTQERVSQVREIRPFGKEFHTFPLDTKKSFIYWKSTIQVSNNGDIVAHDGQLLKNSWLMPVQEIAALQNAADSSVSVETKVKYVKEYVENLWGNSGDIRNSVHHLQSLLPVFKEISASVRASKNVALRNALAQYFQTIATKADLRKKSSEITKVVAEIKMEIKSLEKAPGIMARFFPRANNIRTVEPINS
ncbi:hypothetical protein [Paraburkholderia hayleyella]|uniref:hypothetical protein n=1 Tax=Paraburkholderia hayleyella TaxID=2152889 RepID=UPI001292A512|nr:hypothetical protein [Paraburkholderia hayleyella]